jgi:hypothetical protein
MLSVTSDRLDYGVLLHAPDGYKLDLGIATTYSLDLETLVAASLALSFNETLEEQISGERLALLEALDQLQSRLLVFYQEGSLKVPANFNRLFTLLEPLLVPSRAMDGPDGAFASFHPKIWLLRFASDERKVPVRLRLIVLSRNLTFDRSWDVAIALDGQVEPHAAGAEPRLVRFLHSLSDAEEYRANIASMCESLQSVRWDKPSPFDELSILPGLAQAFGSDAMTPFHLEGKLDELLIVSPFVDADRTSLLQELAVRTIGKKTLISRADTLDAIGAESLHGWEVKSVSRSVVDGEERLHRDNPSHQDLHAKLVVARIAQRTIWHVGSANMTNAAFGKPAKNVSPRNRELMLRMVGANSKLGPQTLLDQWEKTGVFVDHTFSEGTSTGAESNPTFRRTVFALTSATWSIHAQQGTDDSYSVELTVSPLPQLPAGYRVRVGLLCRQAFKELAPSLRWDKLKLTDVSAFVPIEVSSDSDGLSKTFAIQASFKFDLLERRKGAVFRETVDSSKKLLDYLTLLLDSGATKSKWFCADGDGTNVDIFEISGNGGLYEQLLRAAARAPERLTRTLSVFERIHREGVETPPGLEELLRGFAKYSEVLK